MQEQESRKIILRTYSRVWKLERKIYSFQNLKLLFPVSPTEALYFILSILISIVLTKIIPFYNNLHFVLKFVVVPYLLLKFLTKQKIDGKYPHKFLYGYVIYLALPKRYERFVAIDKNTRFNIKANIVFRNKIIVNKTDIILYDKQKKWWCKNAQVSS